MTTLTAVLHATALRRTLLKAEFARHVPLIRQLWPARQVFITVSVIQLSLGQTGDHAALAHRGRSNPLLAQHYVRIALRVPLTKETYLYAILPVIHVSIANQASIR